MLRETKAAFSICLTREQCIDNAFDVMHAAVRSRFAFVGEDSWREHIASECW
jgi:hypothetical protein